MSHQYESVIATGGRIAGIARSSEAASIGLLAAIDGTVDALVGIAKVMSGFSTMLAKAVDEIQAKQITEGDYIDESDIAIDAMERAAAQSKTFLTRLVLLRKTIDADNRLKEHHCEALHDAYESAIDEVAGLIDVLESTRSAIIAHDLKAEPRSTLATFSTVDELITDLRG